jgi:predicted lipid-binding transport protein (Tim44 family)
MMKLAKWLVIGVTSAIVALTVAQDADAKRRLGGGGNSGVQRQQTAPPPAAAPAAPTAGSAAAPSTAAKPGLPAASPAAAMNQAKPSFLSRFGGPIAGILAGTALGMMLANMGIGAGGIGMFLMLLLGGIVAFAIFKIIRARSQGGMQPAMAGMGSAPASAPYSAPAQFDAPAAARNTSNDSSGNNAGGARNIFGQPLATNGVAPAQFDSAYVEQRAQQPKIPADFAVEPFVNEARKQFVRLQAANDAGNVATLRDFLTNELYEELAPEIMSRSGQQRVDIMTLNATLLEVASDAATTTASVRFTGTMKDDAEPTAEGFDEIWHIQKKGNGGWLLAGIQQVS